MRNDPPTHWNNPAHTGPKVAFDTFKHSLLLRRVTARDNGIYRCRMDFRTNPTLEYIANLTVVIPPRRLAIYTGRNVEAQSIVGPYKEGDDLQLTCLASGGTPPPKVIWWDGVSSLDEDSEVTSLEQVANTLVIKNLQRSHLYRIITCQASNSNLTDPLFSTISIDMKFPPLWVKLLTNREALSAGRSYTVTCQAAGARPPARITWALGSTILTSHSEETSHEGNVTTSELHWSPTVADAGKVLQCRAESPSITRAPPLVDDWLLDIYCEFSQVTRSYGQ
ncbi:hypothetical protein SK128_019381 [Halocaridina rubra]|uniref:Ig-like domain-containing protein n=1 Tax=Halocaridina rubra TaxID=373956 RepID=A0AAN8WA44_HALRR